MAKPTYPVQAGVKRFQKPPKPVFYNSWFDAPPLGMLPIQVEGGGRYDGDVLTPGWQEDSFWIGGYYGPRMEIDEAKVKAAFKDHPFGYYYCFNVEHWSVDNRVSPDNVVEDNIRRFRRFFLTAQKYRPDMRWGLYAIAPAREYWTPVNYATGMAAYEKWKRGEQLVDFPDRWAINGVATRKDVDGKEAYVLDNTKSFSKPFIQWQKANDRMGVGFDDKGVKKWDWGMVDLFDYMAPSLYQFYKEDTEAYVKWNVSETRRLGGGRPVYPFIWPDFHPGGGITGDMTIPLDIWRSHVRYVLKYGDGAIIWGADRIRHKEHILIVQDEAERAVSGRV